MEPRVGVLDDALLAERLDSSVRLEADLTLLDVELGEAATVRGHGLHPRVCDHLAAAKAEFSEAGQPRGQLAEPRVSDVTLAEVETPEPGAVGGYCLQGGVTDGLASSKVEVAQLVAVAGHGLHAPVRDEAALCCGEVAEPRAEPGELEQRGVRDPGAVGDAELPQHEAVGGHQPDPRVWNEEAIRTSESRHGRVSIGTNPGAGLSFRAEYRLAGEQ